MAALCGNSILLCAVAFILLLDFVGYSGAYKIGNVNSVRPYGGQRFEPYENGFAGQYGDGMTPQRTRINEGGQARGPGLHGIFRPGVKFDSENHTLSFLAGHSRTNQVLRFELENVAPRQECPGMIGPMPDGAYYCGTSERGYCDRRSGTCHCYVGYEGLECERCRETHFSSGSGDNLVCTPKKLCPSDCTGAGTCDYATGQCECQPHRSGPDCSVPICETISRYCRTCDVKDRVCQQCIDGYFVDNAGQCASCTQFDPRCTECSASSGCTQCADPLLNSVRRSGRRARDVALPFDEDAREFSEIFEFGSQSPRFFDEAEAFSIVSSNDSPLNLVSATCTQAFDASWECSSAPQSHVVCGNFGLISFASPTYAVAESARHVLVQVKRTGGGVDDVAVRYSLRHLTTTDADVEATAQYTSSQTLTFPHGVVALLFRIPIFDDYELEEDESFQLELYDAHVVSTGQSLSLGAQRITTITVHDDDYWVASSRYTSTIDEDPYVRLFSDMPSGQSYQFQVKTRTPAALPRHDPVALGQKLVVFKSLVYPAPDWRKLGQTIDLANRMEECVYSGAEGIYNCEIPIDSVDMSLVHVAIARPGGIIGAYYDAPFALDVPGASLDPLDPNSASSEQSPTTSEHTPLVTRMDSVINFVWGKGPIIGSASDFFTIQWTGAISIDNFVADPSLGSELDIQFRLLANDHVRLFIDGHLLLDHWANSVHSGPNSVARAKLSSNRLHSIQVDYRELRGSAHVSLQWDLGDGNGFVVVPQEALYFIDPIAGSPFKGSVAVAPVSAPRSFASGACLESAVAGFTCSVVVHPRDAQGNYALDLQNEPLELTALLTSKAHPSNTIEWSAVMGDSLVLNPRDYEITFVPQAAGLHLITLQVGDQHIAGSPFLLDVQAGQANAAASDAVGLGVHDDSVAFRTVGVEYAIDIVVRDGFGNVVDTSREENRPTVIVVHQTPPFETYPVTLTASGAADGVFQARYVVQRVGSVDVRLAINGEIFDESTTLDFRNAAPHAGNTYASGAGIAAATSGVEAFFTVHARDEFDNPVLNAGLGPLQQYSLSLTYEDGTVEAFSASSCSHAMDDMFTCRYTPAKSSADVSRAVLQIIDESNGSASIFGGFGFKVSVADGSCDAAQSVASGAGTLDAVAGKTAVIIVQAKDAAGNLRTKPCDAAISLATTQGFVSANYQDGGRYILEYKVTEAGPLLQGVTLGGTSLGNAPFNVQVWPAEVDPSASLVTGDGLSGGVAGEPAEVWIQAKDEFGNNLTRTDSIFEVSLVGSASGEALLLVLGAQAVGGSSLHDGTLPVKTSGNATLTVRLAQPGGVDVAFFNSARLDKDEVKLSRVDNTDLAFDWSYPKSPPIAEKAHGWGARWEGLILAPTSFFALSPTQYELDAGTVDTSKWDIFFRLRTSGGGARLYLDGDLVVNEWPAVRREVSNVYAVRGTNPGSLLSFRLEFAKQPGQGDAAHVSVEWAVTVHRPEHRQQPKDLDLVPGGESFVAVPAATLHRWRQVDSAVPEYVPAVTLPAACEAIQDLSDPDASLLQHVVSAVQSTFYVQMKDTFGNRQIHGDDVLTVVGFAEDHLVGGVDTLADPRFVGNATVLEESVGLWQVDFTPEISGDHLLFVGVNLDDLHADLGQSELLEALYDNSVALSPFQIDVEPGACSSSESYLHGTNLLAAVAGEESWLELQALDAARNARRDENDVTTFVFSKAGVPDESQAGVRFSMTYAADGKFRIEYTAIESGTWDFAIHLSDGGSVSTVIEVEPAEAFAATTQIDALVPANAVLTAGSDSTLQVQLVARDRFGNALRRGGDEFHLFVDLLDRFTPQLMGSPEAGSGLVGRNLEQVYGFGLPWSDYLIEAIDNGDGSYSFEIRFASGLEPGSEILLYVSLANGVYTPRTKSCAVVPSSGPAQGLCTETRPYEATGSTGGLLAEYFLASTDSLPFAVRIDTNNNTAIQALEDLGAGKLPGAQPAFTQWSGYIKAEFTGDYRFEHPHASLRIQGNEITSGSTIKLRGARLYSIKVRSASPGDAALDLTWQVMLGADGEGAVPTDALPGLATATAHSYTILVSDNLEGLLDRGDRIRLGKQILTVEHYDGERQVITTLEPFTGDTNGGAPQAIYRRLRLGRVPLHHLFHSATPIKDQPISVVLQ